MNNDTAQETGGAPAVPDGYMMDSKGRLVPEHLIGGHKKLEAQTVRKIIGYAEDLSRQVARFKGHTFDDVATFLDIPAEKYNAPRGGARGNVTLTSYDGCMKVTVAVQDFLAFGPELRIAKELFDACISKWTVGADGKVRALVDHAFQMDKQGRIDRAALFSLRNLDIDDEEWKAAVAALNDSIHVQGSREYVRFYTRPNSRAGWSPIAVDLASAHAPRNGNGNQD